MLSLLSGIENVGARALAKMDISRDNAEGFIQGRCGDLWRMKFGVIVAKVDILLYVHSRVTVFNTKMHSYRGIRTI